MGKQIWWVLRTYLSNKLFLAALAIVCIWGAIGAVNLLSRRVRLESNIPAIPRGQLMVYSIDSLEAVRRARLQDRVDDINLGGLWGTLEKQRQDAAGKPAGARYQTTLPPDSFYEVLDEFPNLRIVRIDYIPVEPERALRRLAGRQGVQYLSLGGIGPLDLTAVSKLPGLERLDLDVHQPVSGVEKLSALANLKAIVFSSQAAVNDLVLREVASLPHLEIFGIRSHYFNPAITDAGFKQLANAPNLQTFYVGGPDLPSQFDQLARARLVLPTINVQPAEVVTRLPWIAGFFPGVLALGVGLVVANQFGSSTSRLAPGFLSAHAITAAGWLSAIIAAMTFSMWMSRQPLMQSVILCGAAAMFFFSAGVDYLNKRRHGPAVSTGIWDWIISLGTPVLIFSGAIPGATEFAQHWRLAIVTASGVFAGAAVWHSITILRQLPAGNMLDSRLPRHTVPVPTRADRMHAFARRERLIEGWYGVSVSWPLWKRLERWRAGNAPLLALPFILMFSFGGLAVIVALGRARPNVAMAVQVNLWFVPLILLLMVCGQVALVWRKRVTCLDMESLRPLSRSMVQGDWAIALLLDLLAPSAIVGLVIAVVSQLDLNAIGLGAWLLALPGWQSLLGAFVILAPALWAATAATCAVQVVVERQWVRLMLAVPFILVNSAGLGLLLAFRAGGPSRNLTAWDVLQLLWLPSLLSLLVLAWMWRMWTRIDFDRRP